MCLAGIEHLSVIYRRQNEIIQAAQDISFTVLEGESVGLIGESGSGKSTVARAMLGLLPENAKTTGTIFYHGKAALASDFPSLRGSTVTMVGQEAIAALDPLQRVYRQLEETVRRTERLDKKQCHARVMELLTQVGIPDPERTGRQYPHTFSGGMRQRASIAMALACRPRLLIADEPTSSLDVTVQAQLIALFRQIKKEESTALLLITHDMGVAAALCERILVLYAGRLVEEGSAADVFYHPLHPYTRALLRTAKALAGNGQELAPIPGDISSAAQSAGCPFAPRCPFAQPVCLQQMPALPPVQGGHAAACFLQP